MKLKWWLVALALAACAHAGGASEDRDHIDHDDADDDDSLEDDLTLREEESRNVQPRAYTAAAAAAYNALPSGFRPAAGGGGGGGGGASLADLAGYSRRPQNQQLRHPHQGGDRGAGAGLASVRETEDEREEREELEEREEPDRLSALLQQSRFDCGRRPTGYYADEELNCEVFHYCQEGVRHSWICPDSFTFHQVHLICMPPTQENICQQSAKYHFVNEYLYRPVNSEEVARKPNVALRYSERYYPDSVYHDERRGPDDEEVEERPSVTSARPQAQAQVTGSGGQVFRSPEEVNIPLGQRRPQRPYEFRF